jgi:hypothetical protein
LEHREKLAQLLKKKKLSRRGLGKYSGGTVYGNSHG